MNKMIKIAVLFVALAAVASFSQEKGTKFGVRAGFNMYSVDDIKEEGVTMSLDNGFGFGGGLVISVPITNSLTFSPEIGFYYRQLFSYDLMGIIKLSENEFAISIPAMFQFSPSEGMPLYLAAGAQFDIPVSPELTGEYMGQKETEKFDERSSIDIGVVLGLGYHVTENISTDIRFVMGITKIASGSGDPSYKQYGAGVTYFF